MIRDDILWPQPPPDWSLDYNSRRRSPSSGLDPAFPARSAVPKVHVWAAGLDVAPATLHSLTGILSTSELERAARFRFERDRNRFIVGRGLLRTILGRCLQADPRAVEFAYGEHGKPVLAGAFAGSGLHFNLAHSQDLALIAVTLAGPVGVDVERVQLPANADELVVHFLSSRESAAFSQLAKEQKSALFFNLWTRKEARLKATGEGLGSSLNQIPPVHLMERGLGGEAQAAVPNPASVPPPHPVGREPGKSGNVSAGQWVLKDLTPAPGFVAALALAAEKADVHCWRWG